MKYLLILPTTLLLFTFQLCAQSNQGSKEQLKKSLVDIAAKHNGTVGISVVELETGDTLSINRNTQFAMQSVYKFPLALTVLSEVEKGKISLQQKVFISKKVSDRYSWSSLKRQNPGVNFYMSVDSLLMYSVAYSDNLACDLLFHLIGGTKVADKFIHEKGFPNIHIKNTEIEIRERFNRTYVNSSTPTEMMALLKAFYEYKIVNEANTKHLLNYMTNDSTTHQRMIGNLPACTMVAHKTGTGYVNDALINVCNDVGIIYLPNGKHLAVAVFVMNSKETIENTEKLIAVLTREIFDYYK